MSMSQAPESLRREGSTSNIERWHSGVTRVIDARPWSAPPFPRHPPTPTGSARGPKVKCYAIKVTTPRCLNKLATTNSNSFLRSATFGSFSKLSRRPTHLCVCQSKNIFAGCFAPPGPLHPGQLSLSPPPLSNAAQIGCGSWQNASASIHRCKKTFEKNIKRGQIKDVQNVIKTFSICQGQMYVYKIYCFRHVV